MSTLQAGASRPLPVWLKVAGSVFAVGHLLAIALYALGARSGPWPLPAPIYESMAEPPKFASAITLGLTYPYYLLPLRMTHNYHFDSNRFNLPTAYFEVRLKSGLGVETTLKFPDDKANFWVRHRQSILAQGLANDQPLPPAGTEAIPAPGKELPTVEYWDRVEPDVMRLKKVQTHLVPRSQGVDRPSDWSKALAQSYLRYLCRVHNAESAELIRHSRQAITPIALFMPEQGVRNSLGELKSHFGEYRREE